MPSVQQSTSSKKTTNGTGDFSDSQRLSILNSLAKAELDGKDRDDILSKRGVDDLGQVTAWKRLVTQGVLKPTKDKHPHLVKLRQVQGLAKARAVKKAGGTKPKAKMQAKGKKTVTRRQSPKSTRKQAQSVEATAIAEQVVQVFESHDRMREVALACIETIDQVLAE